MNGTYVLEHLIAAMCFGASAGLLLGVFINWAISGNIIKQMTEVNDNLAIEATRIAADNRNLIKILYKVTTPNKPTPTKTRKR